MAGLDENLSPRIFCLSFVSLEVLLYVWSIGSDIVRKQSISNWGDSVIEQLSADLRIAFPEMKGFSARNLWYMKKWFLFYSGDEIKLHQVGAEFRQQKLPQVVAEIPWRQLLAGKHIKYTLVPHF